MNKPSTVEPNYETPDFLMSHVESRLKAENVREGDHARAISVLGECVAGAALVRAYKYVNNINDSAETAVKP